MLNIVFCLPSEYISTLKGKNLLPLGQILSLQNSPFSERVSCTGKKTLVSPLKKKKKMAKSVSTPNKQIMFPHLRGGVHNYPFWCGSHWHQCHTFLSAQYLVNQWLDSYQIFMDT